MISGIVSGGALVPPPPQVIQAVAGTSQIHDAPVGQQQQTIEHPEEHRRTRLMDRRHHRLPLRAGQFAQYPQKRHRRRAVQPGGGFIEHHHAGIREELGPYVHPLPLSARDHAYGSVRALVQPEGAQRLPHLSVLLCVGVSAGWQTEEGRVGELIPYREMIEEDVGLLDVGDATFERFFDGAGDGTAVHGEGTRGVGGSS
mmetsp:Transcript_569/g.1752  ORF Transcript_569/g.1752 Transcript_569/m.1752 type:complete len:200 (+) Transcript_569:1653-2252(+)